MSRYAQIMPKLFNEWIIVDKEILPADSAQDRSPQRFDVAQPLSTLSTARPALRTALEILRRGVQFNLRSKGDPQ